MVIIINYKDINTKLNKWLLFASAVPVLAMLACVFLFFKAHSTGIYSAILLGTIIFLGIVNISITYLLFNSTKKQLDSSFSKIHEWSLKIKEGNLYERLSFSKKSDLYYIASSFNQMADSLQDLIAENTHAVEELQEKNELLVKANEELITALVSAIEAKDSYTVGHSERVSKYAYRLAQKLDFSKDKLEEIRVAGMLHDVGKIGISNSILNKPSRLSKEEFEQVKRHPSLGGWIMNTLDLPKTTLNAINFHHERYDGKGYPLGLKGEELPIETQIISLADAYDAMTSDRPYRKAMSHKAAIEEIKNCSNTQFNPELVDLFDQAHMELTVLN